MKNDNFIVLFKCSYYSYIIGYTFLIDPITNIWLYKYILQKCIFLISIRFIVLFGGFKMDVSDLFRLKTVKTDCMMRSHLISIFILYVYFVYGQLQTIFFDLFSIFFVIFWVSKIFSNGNGTVKL